MKISCQTCHAKYTVADEKVVGRVAKIKCKKCGSTIVVNGNDPSLLAAQPAAGGGFEDEDGGATRVFNDPPSNGVSGYDSPVSSAPDEWTVNISDDDQPVMTSDQVIRAVQDGTVPSDTYVWKDGMTDWLPISEVPELSGALAPAAAPAPAPSAPPAADPYGGATPFGAPADDGGLGSTVMMPEGSRAPYSAPVDRSSGIDSAAARRAGGRAPAVDLFGGHSSEPPADAGPNFSIGGGGGHTGERNENSVLFSLSALTAAQTAAKAQDKRSDAILDLRPSSSAASSSNNGRAALDDIMNIGGGGFSGGPALAPPPLLAPVIEAPPPAAPAMAMSPAMSPMMAMPPEPQAKSKVGLIVGALGGLALIGGVVFFLMAGSGPTAETTSTAEKGATEATEPTAAPTATEVAAADTATPEPTAAPSAEPSAEPEAAVAANPGAPSPAAASTGAATPAKGGSSPAPEKTAAAAPPPEKEKEKPAEAPPAAASGKEFNRGAASSALGAAAGSARSCRKDDGPTGTGRVRVTFAPSGNVTSAQVQGSPFAGTSVGGCVAGVFRGARVPPFDGSPVSVTKSFSIN